MNIKKIIWITVALAFSICLSAQNKSAGINLSIWKGISTQPLDSTQTSYINIGVFSTMNRLNGIGVNLLGCVSRENMSGIQLSGLSNIAGRKMNGIQLAGFTNISGNSMRGIAATGLINITGNDGNGVLLSGLTNISGDRMAGVMMSGLMNITGEKASGFQLSGMANIAGKSFNGMMVSGFLNVTGENLTGIQLAGIANITADKAMGMQIGLCNYATNACGLQIGLINYCQKELKGFQFGLVNASPETKTQLLLYGGNTTAGSIGVRFKNRLFYTILGLGGYSLNLNDKFSASTFYRAGLSLPIYKGFSLSGDMGYEHIESLKNKGNGIPKRLYAIQLRINAEYMITKKFGMFATGGYGWTRRYGHAHNFDTGIIAEAGIIISPK